MRRLSLLILVVAGCDATPAAPTLRCRVASSTTTDVPLHVALKITNDGKRPARVQAVTAKVSYQFLIVYPANGAGAPGGFDYEVTRLDEYLKPIPAAQAVEIKPGSTVTLVCEFDWQLPPAPPSMLAVARASFVIDAREGVDLGEMVETEPQIFVLQSQPGAIEAAAKPANPGEAVRSLAVLEPIEGKRSAGFNRLLGVMRAAAKGAQ